MNRPGLIAMIIIAVLYTVGGIVCLLLGLWVGDLPMFVLGLTAAVIGGALVAVGGWS